MVRFPPGGSQCSLDLTRCPLQMLQKVGFTFLTEFSLAMTPITGFIACFPRTDAMPATATWASCINLPNIASKQPIRFMMTPKNINDDKSIQFIFPVSARRGVLAALPPHYCSLTALTVLQSR